MATINIGSIMNKVGAYSRSVEGKLRMKERINKYASEGQNKTAGGSKVMTEDDMYRAAYKMMDVLKQTAKESDLPPSVMQHILTMDCSRPYKMPDGHMEIWIYFGGDMHRESLEDGDGGHTGEGVNNIVALFNNGAHASDYVYGWWNGHEPTPSTAYRSGWHGGQLGYAWVRSKKDREALHFIQQAVGDFNGNYGSDFNVTAVAGDDYIS